MQYHLFDRVIESDRPLPELTPAAPGAADLQVIWGPAQEQLPGIDTWLHHWREDGATQLSLAHWRQGHLLRFPEEADFYISADKRSITVAPLTGVDHTTLRHQLLDQVAPRLLNQNGQLALHASAVLTATGALLFVGESGAGKSTIAAHLHQRGWPLLCDDSVVIQRHADTLEAIPAYAGVRLLSDSPAEHALAQSAVAQGTLQSGKRRYQMPSPGLSKTPVAAILLLTGHSSRTHFSGSTALSQSTALSESIASPVQGAAAAIALLAASFQLDLTDAAHMRAHLTSVVEMLATDVPVSNLDYQHQPASLRQLEQYLVAAGLTAGPETP